MSIKTWMEEFYQIKPTKRMSKKDAIVHSLRKWEGLTKENIKKHGLNIIYGQMCDDNDDSFGIDSDSCALCIKYISDNFNDVDCGKCPLFKKLGFACGDGRLSDDGWRQWSTSQNPDLMIKNLKSLLVDK